MVDAFLAHEAPLTGLDLYYALERSTSLIEFHTMLRPGVRNRAHSGLQQSYGDHNRLLMLALDKLVEADLGWYRRRLDGSGDVSDSSLRACFRAVAGLELSRETLVALWLAAGLHDSGMLCGRGAYVDVEDGVVVAGAVLEALCPASLRTLATFVLHHHDYIKGVFLGEVPVGLIAEELDTLDPVLHRVALAALGLIQVAGAASLGEGRLGSFRIEIFERCVAGDPLCDVTPATRLARLLEETPRAAAPTSDVACAELERLDVGNRQVVDELLERATVHGWQRIATSLPCAARIDLLVGLAQIWAKSGANHVVLTHRAAEHEVQAMRPDLAQCHHETALSGARLLVLEL
jgi:hypothetical protein